MNKILFNFRKAALLCLSVLSVHLISAQSEDHKIKLDLLHIDSSFWKAYNTCDDQSMSKYYTHDVEFYHDKSGLSLGSESLTTSFKQNLCSGNLSLRREEMQGTVEVHLLKKNDEVYGAILSGNHIFYILEKGKKERLDGQAKFTHVWIKEGESWKMSRILSYDHKPADYINPKKEVSLSADQLKKWEGTYNGTRSNNLKVSAGNQMLILGIGNNEFEVFPKSDKDFFSKERDLTFEFSSLDGGSKKLIVREKGEIAEELNSIH